MDDGRVKEVLEMYDANLSPAAIAEELGISVAVVRKALQAQGRDTKRRVVVQGEQSIVLKYSTDVPVPEILHEFGITYTQLYSILSRNEIPLRKSVGAPGKSAALDAAVTAYQDGLPLWKIADETGVAQPTLHAELHRRNIPLRRPRRNGSV